MLPMGFGDDWLRFNGIGENVTWGMYNNDNPTEAQKEQLYQVLRWAASRGMTATFHWHNDKAGASSARRAGARQRRDADRARCAGRSRISTTRRRQSLARMKAMGVGWLMQNAFYFRGEAFLGQRGDEAGAARAADRSARCNMGVPVGGGTDAHRVMWPNPFVSLQWMLDGKTVGGIAMRGAGGDCRRGMRGASPLHRRQRLVRLRRGQARLARGRQARRPRGAEQGLSHRAGSTRSAGIVSLLTMVGGRVVYADGPFAAYEEKPPFR